MVSGCRDDPDRRGHDSRQVHNGQLQGQDDLGAVNLIIVQYHCNTCLFYICTAGCFACVKMCPNVLHQGWRHRWGRDVQLLPHVLGRRAGKAQKRTVCLSFYSFLPTNFFSSKPSLSLSSRCVSVGPPVYSWGRIWPIGGEVSAKYWLFYF